MVKKISWFCFGILISFSTSNSMNAPEVPFENIKRYLEFAVKGLSRVPTKAFHCRKYGYNGTLIHIVKYPDQVGIGHIIENAQPSMFWGYWYADSCVPQNRIFIEDDNVKCEAEIKSGADTEPKILSSYFFSNNLAVMWEVASHLIKRADGISYWDTPSEKKCYITRASLSEIQSQNNIFDLDSGKVEVSDK
ncbi:MAG: hypothetical protein AMXMBFR12_03910 [Candidatus Babeliales bacterium]